MRACLSHRWNPGSRAARIRQYCTAGALLALVAGIGAPQAAEQVSIEASSRGSAVEIEARATIRAPYALIWQTLTDYDHLSDFIPGMKKSHVIDRRGNAAVIEQSGKAAILFFDYPIEVVIESLEKPPAFIGVRVLKGNLKQLEGGYRLEKIADTRDEFVLRWSGLIEPSLPVPLFISMPLLRANIRDQFRGMVREIERREALRAASRARAQ
jgi:ribosome-associated toxin RatA of RatAB toxin-antitoxin module